MLGVPIAVWSLLLYLLTGHLNKTQVFILVFSNQIEDEQFYIYSFFCCCFHLFLMCRISASNDFHTSLFCFLLQYSTVFKTIH